MKIFADFVASSSFYYQSVKVHNASDFGNFMWESEGLTENNVINITLHRISQKHTSFLLTKLLRITSWWDVLSGYKVDKRLLPCLKTNQKRNNSGKCPHWVGRVGYRIRVNIWCLQIRLCQYMIFKYHWNIPRTNAEKIINALEGH